jgi:hypothetical protein
MITVYRHDEPWVRTIAIEFPRKSTRNWGLCAFTISKWKLEDWVIQIVVGYRKRLIWEAKR